MEDTDADELPEAIQLHAALALACLALDLIANDELSDPKRGAEAAITVLRRDYPVSRQHLPKNV
jgi:hypothetical protein